MTETIEPKLLLCCGGEYRHDAIAFSADRCPLCVAKDKLILAQRERARMYSALHAVVRGEDDWYNTAARTVEEFQAHVRLDT